MNNNKAIADAFAACCITYDQTFSVEKARVYSSLLEGYSPQEISEGFRKHMTDPDRGRFFPKPADIIHQMQVIRSKSQSGGISLLWSQVVKSASKGLVPKTDDQILLAALQLIGGHKVVGYADPAELVRLQREFEKSYQAIEKASAQDLPGHLQNIEALKAAKTGLIKR